MIYKVCLIGLLGILLFESCYDDKGNYSYRAINEITVKHDFFGDTVLRMYSFVDTLRVFPEISTTVNHDPDNYEYEWVAVGGDPTIGGQYTLGKEKDLVYPITLPSQRYSVYFKIQDKSTGLTTISSLDLQLATLFSQGWLVLGEGDDGRAQLDMVSTGGEDTTLLKNILQEVDIQEWGKPTYVFVPPYRPAAALNYIHVGTDKGTYRLSTSTLLPIEGAHLKWSFYDVSAAGECVMTEAVQIMGYYRAALVDGNLYYTELSGQQSCFFGPPSNHYKGDYDLFPVGDKIGYSVKERGQAIVLYNERDRRFVYQQSGYGTPVGYCADMSDRVGDPFSWNPGYEYVTTVNCHKGSGSTYTILRDGSDFYLYSYRISYNYGIIKQLMVKMDNVIDLDKAEFFGASNMLSVIYYTVGNKLYGYDFAGKKCELLKTFDGYEITLFLSDILVQTSRDYFYIALYDPSKPASTGGIIKKYKVVDDVDHIIIEEEKGSEWKNLCKVKSMAFKSR